MDGFDFDSIGELLRTQADARPHSPAILTPGRPHVDFAGLWQIVQAISRHLHSMGISHEDRVALVMPNGPDMALAFLAVASHCASAPLNPAYGWADCEFYLADLHASALIVAAGFDTPARAVAATMGIPIIDLPPAFPPPIRNPQSAILRLRSGQVRNSPQDVALILHTSGTTARPKMVPLTQANLCASAASIGRSLDLRPTDRYLNVMPLFHIHELMAGVLASLAAGGSVVCTPGFDAEQFFGWADECAATWYSAVPTMHQAILAQARRQPHASRRARFRFVRSSSAALPPSVMAELERVFRAPVIEAYGMTEASHQMASNPLPPQPRKAGSVGMPAGAEIAIMAEDGPTLLAPGARGEVVIRGAGVTAGYLDNPEANAAAFVAGWFRTGDQGFFDADGYFFLSGRIKEVINRGGEKVSPREVDDVLLAHPAVVQAVTFAVPHPTLGEDVAAAVVIGPSSGDAPIETELRQFAFSRLPGFKVPSQIVVVPEIPTGPTGKLQRLGLAERLGAALRPPYLQPRTLVEELLAGIWRQVLGVEAVGAFDNFFTLGGDSLQAGRVIARLTDEIGLELEWGALFRAPTLAELGRVVEEMLLQEAEHAGNPTR